MRAPSASALGWQAKPAGRLWSSRSNGTGAASAPSEALNTSVNGPLIGAGGLLVLVSCTSNLQSPVAAEQLGTVGNTPTLSPPLSESVGAGTGSATTGAGAGLAGAGCGFAGAGCGFAGSAPSGLFGSVGATQL